MHKVVLSCETVTPLLSRSIVQRNGRYDFELRPQSIKGMMHFWFRALAPTVIDPHQYQGKKQKFLGIKKLEELIFGSTEHRSSFSISVAWDSNRIKNVSELLEGKEKYVFRNALFGTYPMGNTGAYYSYLDPQSSLEVTFRFRRTCSESLREFVISLFVLLVYYGGLGAKTHHGFGSIKINRMSGINIDKTFPKMPDTAAKRLIDFINETDSRNESFALKDQITMFSDLNADEFPNLVHASEMIRFQNMNSWKEIIRAIVAMRSRDGKPATPWARLKLEALRGYNTPNDIMDDFREVLFRRKSLRNTLVIKPSIMGLPINYQRIGEHKGKVGKDRVSVTNIVYGEPGRKASPIYISIQVDKNNKYFARLLLMASMISESRKNGSPILKVEINNRSYEALGNEDFENLWHRIGRN
ncbi:type III-B CRISPR module RAMP protein Cmr1 [Kosmotoga arenicorallina]|uniref:type III-B CRISPR module RAMP protein Cmr1 n=1 Tax=Kosmotoga arenicorallina TaxID=688066 RepID=UPI001372D0E8|nr:type III-B CRISPR module RAMP protein Cmr1 [Kosmotoga arenicorallina]